MAQNEIYFFDISKNHYLKTKNKDIPVITNEESVIESVNNIISTQPGERLMNPDFGCDLKQYLFQPLDIWYASSIAEEIKRAIGIYEPRANNIVVEVSLDYDNNLYEIEIIFNVVSTEDPLKIKTSLEKIR